MDNIKFGKFIQELRKEKNMTQKDLAEKLYLTNKAISKWERGLSFPDITTLHSLAEVLGVEVSEILNGERGNEEKIDIEKAVQEALEQIDNNEEKRKNKILKIRKIVGIISVIVFILFLILQTWYLFVLKRYGFEYVIDYLFYIVNQIIIVFGTLALFSVIHKKDIVKNIITIVLFAVLTMINSMYIINNGFDNECIIDFSDDFSNQLVIKKNDETGETMLYRNANILFAKPKEQFSYSVDSKIKTQWLTNDICSLTYEDIDGNIREYVVTYGDRGNGNSYYYVTNALYGHWQVSSQNGTTTELLADSKGITIKKDEKTELFEYSNTRQFGTIALVLYSGEIPRYVIALNEDCKIDDTTGIIEEGGTISLTKVSLEKTITESLYCMTYKGGLDSNNYQMVDMDAFDYRIKNGILYISYDGNEIIEVPGDYTNVGSYNDFTYQITKEKTIFFYTSNEKRYLVYSDDMGKNWNTTEISNTSTIQNIHFINSNIGFMLEFDDVAMTLAAGKISKTTDGGKTWQAVSNGVSSGGQYIFKTSSQIKFIDENLGFLTMPLNGDSGTLYITKNTGDSFEPVEVTPGVLKEAVGNLTWNDVYDYYHLPTLENGRLYLEISQGSDGDYNGGDSKIYFSSDHGNTWNYQE